MSEADVSFSIIGAERTRDMLAELPAAAQNRVIKPLMRDAAKDIAKLEKAESPKDTGLMKKALGSTPLKTYGETFFIATGVRRGFEKDGKNPTKYAHLVSGGRKETEAKKGRFLADKGRDKFFGKKVAAVAPNPFVDRAFRRAKNETVPKLETRGAELIEQEAAKLAK